MRVKPACHDVVEQQHGPWDVAGQGLVGQCEIRVVVEHMQLLGHGLVGQVLSRKCDELVEHGQGITQRSICFLCNHMQRLFLSLNFLLRCDVLQVRNGIWDRDAVEVEDLATRQDGGQDLVLFRRGQNEHRMGWRFLEGFQECVERSLTQHVHLIDDVHLVFPLLRGNANLIHDAADVLDFVVGRRIEFKDVERHRLFLTFEAVDGLGKNPGRRGLSNATRTTEEVRLSDLT